MEALKSALTDQPWYLPYCVAIGTVVATSVVLYKLFLRRHGFPLNEELLKGPPDTVTLFQLKRGPYAPSLSPFPLKLETYLRMANIPYRNNCQTILSSKGKTPWIAYNGEAVADSQFCIEYLNAKRGVDLNKHLTPEQKAIAKSFQILVDEHLYWALVHFRWFHGVGPTVFKKIYNFPRIVVWRIDYNLKSQLWGQGMGRHGPEEIRGLLMVDFAALSQFLGNKPFIMGDEPCEPDCAIFGMLAQFEWQQKDEVLDNILEEKFPNLHRYCLRMKERFWPDWDECLGEKKK